MTTSSPNALARRQEELLWQRALRRLEGPQQSAPPAAPSRPHKTGPADSLFDRLRPPRPDSGLA